MDKEERWESMRRISLLPLASLLILSALARVQPADRSWIATSNNYTNMLLAVTLRHHPEFGSAQGLSQYDALVSRPTLADEDQERQETAAVLAKLKSAVGKQSQKEVAQDLQIVIRRIELDFREEDFRRAHEVPFLNVSNWVFGGLRILLDEQTPAERRPAAVSRLRKYA